LPPRRKSFYVKEVPAVPLSQTDLCLTSTEFAFRPEYRQGGECSPFDAASFAPRCSRTFASAQQALQHGQPQTLRADGYSFKNYIDIRGTIRSTGLGGVIYK